MGYHARRSETDPTLFVIEKLTEGSREVVFRTHSPDALLVHLFETLLGIPLKQEEPDNGPRHWAPRNPLTPAEIAQAIHLGKDKRPASEILAKIGREPFAVEHLSRVCEQEADGICELRRYGWSYRRISELTGRNTNTIGKVIADDLTGSRRSDKKWRCRECGALNIFDTCESCRVKRIANSFKLNQRDARRHGLTWWRKLRGRPLTRGRIITRKQT